MLILVSKSNCSIRFIQQTIISNSCSFYYFVYIDRMKTLTVRNPWARLICQGYKDIENRSWPPNYTGKILIHTSGRIDKDFKLNSNQKEMLDLHDLALMEKENYINGAIIGEVDIIGCINDSDSIWAIPGHYHWILENPILYNEPILNIKGKLKFWEFTR